MQPSKIFDIMDLARRVRKQDKVFNPLFVGPAGVGKSSVVQQWCKKNNLPFIDLRAAYLEAPDIIGYPSVENIKGLQRTVHNLPEFWPTEGEGVLLLEEPNRGTTAIMNTFMQLLTDRAIHKYTLPKGWIIVGAINPENEHYDVNTMDTALKNRFQIFDVDYDRKTFIDYMKKSGWDKSITMFVESNTWTFVRPEEMGNSPGAKYISPRTLEQLNNAVVAGIDKDDEFLVYESILGKNYGKAFYAFRNNERPVLFDELVNDKKKAIARLKKFSDPNAYKNSLIAITISDIVDNKDKVKDDLLAEVLLTLPADAGPTLIRDLEFSRKVPPLSLTKKIFKDFPEVKKHLQNYLNEA